MTLGDGKYMRLGKRIVHTHAPVAGNANDGHDFACGVCGHLLCSCSAEAPEPYTYTVQWMRHGSPQCDQGCELGCLYKKPEPPKDVLPEGWAMEGYTMWRHSPSGAWVQPYEVFWAWSGTRGGTCTGAALAKTREEAMAAALASVAPVEPSKSEEWAQHKARL